MKLALVGRSARNSANFVRIAVSGLPNPLSEKFDISSPERDFLNKSSVNVIIGYPTLGANPWYADEIEGMELYVLPLFLLRHELRNGRAGHLLFLLDKWKPEAEIAIILMERNRQRGTHDLDCAYTFTTHEEFAATHDGELDEKKLKNVLSTSRINYYDSSTGTTNDPQFRDAFKSSESVQRFRLLGGNLSFSLAH